MKRASRLGRRRHEVPEAHWGVVGGGEDRLEPFEPKSPTTVTPVSA